MSTWHALPCERLVSLYSGSDPDSISILFATLLYYSSTVEERISRWLPISVSEDPPSWRKWTGWLLRTLANGSAAYSTSTAVRGFLRHQQKRPDHQPVGRSLCNTRADGKKSFGQSLSLSKGNGRGEEKKRKERGEREGQKQMPASRALRGWIKISKAAKKKPIINTPKENSVVIASQAVHV